MTVTGPLLGTYTATLPEGLDAPPGEWGLTIDEQGLMLKNPYNGSLFQPGNLVGFTESELVLDADSGCTRQSGTPTQGRYGWTLEGDTLVLTAISDSCQDRIDTLTAAPWRLQP